MWQIQFKGAQVQAERLAHILGEIALSTTFFETQERFGDDLVWTLTAMFETRLEAENFVHYAQRDGLAMMNSFALEPVPNKDWLAENRKTFAAIDTGRFYIYGSHDDTKHPDDRIQLCIDAATAFGTGHHGTTLGCLEALCILSDQGQQPQTIMDVGTGTGILAMGAHRLFGKHVIATDNDPEAVSRALENFERNACPLTCVLDEILEHPTILSHAPYDLITANILAEPLVFLAPMMATHMAPKGHIILSGLLTNQAPMVIDAYVSRSFKLIQTLIYGEWATLILKK